MCKCLSVCVLRLKSGHECRVFASLRATQMPITHPHHLPSVPADAPAGKTGKFPTPTFTTTTADRYSLEKLAKMTCESLFLL